MKKQIFVDTGEAMVTSNKMTFLLVNMMPI